jgi:hypothetical protein
MKKDTSMKSKNWEVNQITYNVIKRICGIKIEIYHKYKLSYNTQPALLINQILVQ